MKTLYEIPALATMDTFAEAGFGIPSRQSIDDMIRENVPGYGEDAWEKHFYASA